MRWRRCPSHTTVGPTRPRHYSALTKSRHLPCPLVCPTCQISNIVIIKVAVENMTLNGRLRLTLRPLLGNLPLVGSGAGWGGGGGGPNARSRQV